MHAFGHVEESTRPLVPADKLRRVVWEARVFMLCSLGSSSPRRSRDHRAPVVCRAPVVLRRLAPVFFAITQHAGLREDVLDHRMNTRTVYINPVFRFLYLNMNYHVEHHLFPGVPYYNLPALHEEIKVYLPPPKTSMLDAYREIIHALESNGETRRELPVPDFPDGPYVPKAQPTGRARLRVPEHVACRRGRG